MGTVPRLGHPLKVWPLRVMKEYGADNPRCTGANLSLFLGEGGGECSSLICFVFTRGEL